MNIINYYIIKGHSRNGRNPIYYVDPYWATAKSKAKTYPYEKSLPEAIIKKYEDMAMEIGYTLSVELLTD